MSLRDQVLIPFRGLPRDVAAGSVVLLRLLLRAAFAGLRAASTPPDKPTPAPKKTPARRLADGAEGQDAEEDDEPADAGRRPTRKTAAARAESGADQLERFGLAGLALLLSLGSLGTLAALLAHWVGTVLPLLAAAWVVSAALLAPPRKETPTENDHETSGEEPEDAEPEEDDEAARAAARREALRLFVEHQVAAGAAGRERAKGRGARVDDLLAALQAKGSVPDWDREAMIGLLQWAGITVRPQMKFRVDGRQKNVPGVHVQDLADDLGRTPRLPASLVPDLTPAQAPHPTPAQAPQSTPSEGAPVGPAPAGAGE